MYLWLKNLHVTCALISFAGFLLRGWWMLRGSALLNHRVTRVLPHVNDSILLLAAIGLTVILGQYPLAQGWLTAKLTALVLYILLGSVALKRGGTKRIRGAAMLGAVISFGYILGVALTHRPVPWG